MQGCISSPGVEKEKAHGLLNAYVSLFLNCHALCIGFSHHHRHVEFKSIEGRDCHPVVPAADTREPN
jgi:hypothetical protein